MRSFAVGLVSALPLVGSVGSIAAKAQTMPEATGPAAAERQAVVVLRLVGTVQAGRPAGPFLPLSEVLRAPVLAAQFPAASMPDAVTADVGGRTLTLTVSVDGRHFQAMVAPGERCGVAAFTDESGVIFIGRALGCEVTGAGPADPGAR